MVPHHSTDSAINCLTAQIGRDAVGLVVYGRNSKVIEIYLFKYRLSGVQECSRGRDQHTWKREPKNFDFSKHSNPALSPFFFSEIYKFISPHSPKYFSDLLGLRKFPKNYIQGHTKIFALNFCSFQDQLAGVFI